MKSMSRLLGFLMVVGAVGCAGPEIPEVVTGEWGGERLGLVASTTGAELEYDCALGRIADAIRPGGSGRFSAVGTHFPGQGGPIRIDEMKPGRPARYDGTVRGDKMTITVTLTDSSEVLGTFMLVRSASPRVFKCL